MNSETEKLLFQKKIPNKVQPAKLTNSEAEKINESKIKAIEKIYQNKLKPTKVNSEVAEQINNELNGSKRIKK